MYDQLFVNDTGSYDDFGFSLASRKIEPPAKKTVKESVPYSNEIYDFSKINGELYWQERKLEYVFEATAPTPEKLEEIKTDFANWIMNVFEEDIHDPFIEDYHFKGSFDEMDFEDDEGMDKTTATVTFAVYPYKIANIAKRYEVNLPASGSSSIVLINKSNHRVVPTITVEADTTIAFENLSLAVSAGKVTDDRLSLNVGENIFTLGNPNSQKITVLIEYQEEVL